MAKQLETISGTVEQVNAKGTGIKVAGEWLNVSNYHPVAEMPTPGELVECTIERSDRGAWINSLRIIGAAPAPVLSTTRDTEIRRQVAIKTAAQLVGAFAQMHEEVRVEHVFPLADKILAWLEQQAGDATA
ncbi:MAG: hypothetical protein JO352_03600 [Chloroflexi bacterium]|nr:hypothetical protein [Chloroflexota bacterium]MBV9602891.1 hypothetical protein [Chloroflexota bacterium]